MDATVVNNLLQSALSYPDKVAIIHGDKSTDYKSLWKMICQCSDFLSEHGLKQADRVALQHENSIEYIVTYYATLKAGGVIVALNIDAKQSDISNILQHSDAKYFFASHKKCDLGALKDIHDIEIVDFDGEGNTGQDLYDWTDVISHQDSSNDKSVELDANSVAAIIYTSGTTGNPKGVTLSHLSLQKNIESIIEYLTLTENDVVLNVLPFFYSYGNSVLHTHLSVGATICLENSLMYPVKVIESMVRNQATGFSGVPSTFALLLSRTKLEEYDLSCLRYVTQAGGAMPPSNISEFLSKIPGVKFFVMYGQTEATARITYLPPESLSEKIGSVGIPIPGVEVEIRNDKGEKAAVDAVGELYVSGQNIMQGYWKNPEATAEVLNDGWLKTGDIGYKDPDGYIFLSGRKADMIKVGGHRISPLEIEEVISQVENVEEVAATGITDDMLGQVVKAVVVLKDKHDKAIREIKAHCSKQLASYKIPKQIEIVEALPKTSSGKVKRFLL